MVTARNSSWASSAYANFTVLETRRASVRVVPSKTSYLEGERILLSGVVNNTGNVPVSGFFNLTLRDQQGARLDVTEPSWVGLSLEVGRYFAFSREYVAAGRSYGKPLALAVSEGVLPVSVYTANASFVHAVEESNSSGFIVGGIIITVAPPDVPIHLSRNFASTVNIYVVGSGARGLETLRGDIADAWIEKGGVRWELDRIDYRKQARDSLSAANGTAGNYSITVTAPSEKGQYVLCLRMVDGTGGEGVGCGGFDVSAYQYNIELVFGQGDVSGLEKNRVYRDWDLPHKYAAVSGPGYTMGLVNGGRWFYNLYWKDCGGNACVGLTQEIDGGKAILAYTPGGVKDLEARTILLEKGGFWGLPNPSFGYPLTDKYLVRLALRYPYAIINGSFRLPEGTYQIAVTHEDDVNDTPVIRVEY